MTVSTQHRPEPDAGQQAVEPGLPLPTVSVVIIFYNAERFLAAAIDSVFAQTYESWELILVDDGSTDDSSLLARDIAARHPFKVRHVTHPGGTNHGMSASRNLGIAEGRGALVAFLDADDVWLPFKLAHQVDLLQRYPEAGLVYGPTEYWFSWTGEAADRTRDFRSRLAVDPGRVIQPPLLLVLALETHGGMLPGICSLIVRRTMIERFGGFEPDFKGSYEDQVFFTKMFRHVPILITDRCSDRYRQHDDSCCAVAQRTGEYDPDKPHPARQRYLEWLDAYLAAHPLAENDALRPRLHKALAREWMPYRRPLLYAVQEAIRRLKRLPRSLASVAKKRLPERLRSRLRRYVRERRLIPPVGWVRFGSLRRLAPISRDFGYERGTPVDRYHVEAFLARHAQDIRGHVLEVGDNSYTRRFGGDAVTKSAVLNLQAGVPGTTVVADLADAPQIPSDTYDCIILTQTLQYVLDLKGAVRTLHRILKPGGVILATAPGLTQIVECPWRERWYWGLTDASVKALFLERFPKEMLQVTTPGNVVSVTAFLQGIAANELRPRELLHDDPDYQLLVTVRAERPTTQYLREMSGRWDYTGRGIQAYGDDTTYVIGMEFVDLEGATIEDWGCGLTYARRFVQHGRYYGVDGSASRFADRIADLSRYRSEVDCVFMRHVLEHNPNWQPILDNALASFRKRMALILFTPFVEQTKELAQWSGIPDLAFRKEDLTSRFPPGLRIIEREVKTNTQYGVEHVFLLERMP